MAITVQPARKGHVKRAARIDDMCRAISDDIIHGRLAPGTIFDELDLSRRFAAKRPQVREALRQLCLTGLAERVPYSGIVVAAIALERVRDLFIVMAELEACAARLSARHMTPAERRALEDHHLASREFVHDGSHDAYAVYNVEFHSMLYAGSHNAYLEEVLLATRRRLIPFRRAQFNLLGRLSASHGEHDVVVQAILRGDAVAAGDAMRVHLMSVSAAAARYVSNQLPPTVAATTAVGESSLSSSSSKRV
jgi:DNA-binding GntR family transcriptional regulator